MAENRRLFFMTDLAPNGAYLGCFEQYRCQLTLSMGFGSGLVSGTLFL